MPFNFFVKKRKLDSGFQSQSRNKRSRDVSDTIQSGASKRNRSHDVTPSSKTQTHDDANEEIVSSEDEEFDYDEIEGEEKGNQLLQFGIESQKMSIDLINAVYSCYTVKFFK